MDGVEIIKDASVYADLKAPAHSVNSALFTAEAAPYWNLEAKHFANMHPWMAELRVVNREQAALVISQTLEISLELARAKHDKLTGVHKTMHCDKPESVRPWAMEAPFREILSRIPSLQAISPALAATLKPKVAELQS